MTISPLWAFAILLLLTMSSIRGCPPSCICKWRNGKQTVECLGRSLLIIPEGIDSATQVLDASGNNILHIPGHSFLKIGLINLQKLFLSRCGIKTIHEEAFKGLSNLVELDLSENMLGAVPTLSLLNCPSLMRLSLSKNPITSLERLAFNHLSFLTTLDLSGCEINQVDEAAFRGLYSLEWIDLSGNKIKTFPDMRSFPNRLKGVQLQDNPWSCDCNIRTFSTWLKRDVLPVLLQPVCREPEKLRGLAVKKLMDVDLACSPEVAATDFYFEAEEGRNITLTCRVRATPEAKVSWMFKGKLLQEGPQDRDYFIDELPEAQGSKLNIYNVNSEFNGTFYCLAENPAGVTIANYTIAVMSKQAPNLRFQEDKGLVPFPIDTSVLALILAGVLVLTCLCFAALIMALCEHHSKAKRRRQELVKNSENARLPGKSILKATNGVTDNNVLVTDGLANGCEFDVSHRNPDIIRGISNVVDCRNGVGMGSFTFGKRSKPQPIMVAPATLGRRPIRNSTQPYLKPTLTSKCRPISAPTFERYVEHQNLRCTIDGYPQRRHMDHHHTGRQISYSECSSPKRRHSQPYGCNNKYVSYCNELGHVEGVSFGEDVQL